MKILILFLSFFCLVSCGDDAEKDERSESGIPSPLGVSYEEMTKFSKGFHEVSARKKENGKFFDEAIERFGPRKNMKGYERIPGWIEASEEDHRLGRELVRLHDSFRDAATEYLKSGGGEDVVKGFAMGDFAGTAYR